MRAGVLEQGTVDILTEAGRRRAAAPRGPGAPRHRAALRRPGPPHRLRAAGTGRAITVYGQQEVVKDLIAARLAAGGTIHFEVEDVARARHRRPTARRSPSRRGAALDCDVIAGCDGFHGVSRAVHPRRRAHGLRARPTPSPGSASWPKVPPSTEELIYAYTRARLRAAQHALARAQPPLPAGAARTTSLDDWPDERIWAELKRAAGDRRRLRARRPARSSRRASRRCAASWPSRCGTAGSSSPATPRTSCRPPAPRASTSPSPTCACSPRRSPLVRDRVGRAARRGTRTPASSGSGGPSTSPGG